MSLWCPYIKANYCFLWSCNKYILRHPVAKGTDGVQKGARKHVFLVTGKGPQQHWVSQPGIPQLTLPHHCSCTSPKKEGKTGSIPWDSTSDQEAKGRLCGGRPEKPWMLPVVLCHSSMRSMNSDDFNSPCSVCSWATWPHIYGAIIGKLSACHMHPWMCALSGKVSRPERKSDSAT